MGQLTVVSPQPEPDEVRSNRRNGSLRSCVRSWKDARCGWSLPSRLNPVVIVGEPADEIAEAWQDFYSLALVWLAAGRSHPRPALHRARPRPQSARQSVPRHGALGGRPLRHAPQDSQGEGARASSPTASTRSPSALDLAREENSGLYRQLISVQEEERREIANELHDEAGPCLFGITANASSIQTIADQLNGPRTPEINHRVGEILGIVERLKLMNRALLKKLQARVARAGWPRRAHQRAGCRLRAPPSRYPHRLFGGKARQILWRADRRHALSLHSGRHHQCHPARPRQELEHRPRRGIRPPARRRQAAALGASPDLVR